MIDPTKRTYNLRKRFAFHLVGRETSAFKGFQRHLDKIGYDQEKAIHSVEKWGLENGFHRGPGEDIREFIVRCSGIPLEQIEREMPLLLARCDGSPRM